GTGQGVYMSAVAEQIVDEHEIARGVDVFSRRSLMHGGAVWAIDDLQNEAGLRLYRAVADAHWISAEGRQARSSDRNGSHLTSASPFQPVLLVGGPWLGRPSLRNTFPRRADAARRPSGIPATESRNARHMCR
ncbi:MAG: hypothetical protein V7646_5024, partial [Pseudonocardia sp.]